MEQSGIPIHRESFPGVPHTNWNPRVSIYKNYIPLKPPPQQIYPNINPNQPCQYFGRTQSRRACPERSRMGTTHWKPSSGSCRITNPQHPRPRRGDTNSPLFLSPFQGLICCTIYAGSSHTPAIILTPLRGYKNLSTVTPSVAEGSIEISHPDLSGFNYSPL